MNCLIRRRVALENLKKVVDEVAQKEWTDLSDIPSVKLERHMEELVENEDNE